MQGVSYLDGAAALILTLALLRGIWLGLIREAFSIAALGAAVPAVVKGVRPHEGWLLEQADLGMWAPWLAGLLLVVGAVASVAGLGRLLRRGVPAAGLGWADRAGGALLGALEGALVVVLLLVGATALLGRDHQLLAGASTVELLKVLSADDAGPAAGRDVAAPPPG